MILVLRALGVGDLAAGVPAIRAIRAHFPDRTLALAAPAWLTPLIDLIGGVDRVLPVSSAFRYEGPSPSASSSLVAGSSPSAGPLPSAGSSAAAGLPLAAGEVEVAINLHGSGPESHQLLASVRPERIWAFVSAAAGFTGGPTWTDEEHERDRWCRMLGHYGVAADPDDTDLAVPEVAVPHDVTILHPGAKSPSRRWPVERYAAVARALADAGHKVVVTGSDAERPIALAVAGAAGLGASAVLPTDLAELAALVAHARLLISGDTGVAHLATAYRTPSVTLFGPMPPRRWGPPSGRPYHHAIWHGSTAERGDSPGPQVHPALLAVTADEVLVAVRSLSSLTS